MTDSDKFKEELKERADSPRLSSPGSTSGGDKPAFSDGQPASDGGQEAQDLHSSAQSVPGGTGSQNLDAADIAAGTDLKAGSPTDPYVGSIVGGKFEIISLIGEGGMGSVYKARHITLAKTVAVKVLNSVAGKRRDEHLRRFDLEARAASKLSHANVVSVSDYGLTEDGAPYLVMDYAEGVSLSDLIEQSGPLPWQKAVPIFMEICAGLAHAHDQGLIHRDLKPSNVIVKSDGSLDTARVVDFGIAKLIEPSEEMTKITQTGEVFGSPLYMSPEQCTGKKVDERSDIYSMGCLMYETLTGSPPHVGAGVIETIFRQMHEEARALPVEREPGASMKKLNAVVLRCLDKDPAQRYQSMAELKRDLEAATNDQIPLSSAARSRLPRLLRMRAREIAIYAAMVMLIVALFQVKQHVSGGIVDIVILGLMFAIFAQILNRILRSVSTAAIKLIEREKERGKH